MGSVGTTSRRPASRPRALDAGSFVAVSLASSASTASVAGSSSTDAMARNGRTGEITGRRILLSGAGQA